MVERSPLQTPVNEPPFGGSGSDVIWMACTQPQIFFFLLNPSAWGSPTTPRLAGLFHA